MIFKVDFGVPVEGVPADVVAELRARMLDIARVLGAMPESNPIWQSMVGGGLFLDVRRWRFHYRVDRPSAAIIVDQVLPLPE